MHFVASQYDNSPVRGAVNRALYSQKPGRVKGGSDVVMVMANETLVEECFDSFDVKMFCFEHQYTSMCRNHVNFIEQKHQGEMPPSTHAFQSAA